MVVRGHWQLAKMLLRKDDADAARNVAREGLAIAETLELPVVTERLRALSE